MSDSPRVLLVSPEYPPVPGGIGDYTALLARHLALVGTTVSVLTSGNASPQSEEHDEYSIPMMRHVRHWGWRLASQVRHAARRMHPEIVHIQYQTGMYGMHPAINLLPRLLGGRYRVVTTFHDLRAPYLFPKAGPLRDRATRLLTVTSDAVIVTNGADRATLQQWNIQPALVPIGSNIPPAPWLPTCDAHAHDDVRLRTRYDIPFDVALLTTFGLLNQSKGLETVIDALALLRADDVPAYLLVIGAGTGANDPTNRATDAALSARIAAKGLTTYVKRTGPLSAPEVAEALAMGDACLLPYRDGASPRRGSLLAALTQGVPVVTTNPTRGAYDGLPPFSDAVAALVPPDDATAVAAKARHILSDREYAMRLGTYAFTYAAQFAWGAIARRTLAVYAGDAEMHASWSGMATVQVGAGTETGPEWQ